MDLYIFGIMKLSGTLNTIMMKLGQVMHEEVKYQNLCLLADDFFARLHVEV